LFYLHTGREGEMNDLRSWPGRAHRLDSVGRCGGVSCDANGPNLGPVRLLRRTIFGFEPRPAAELDFILSRALGAPVEMAKRRPDLESIARALDEGEFAEAAIATLHMRLPVLDEAQAARARAAEKLVKAGFNPDEPRDERGRWTSGGGGGDIIPIQYVSRCEWKSKLRRGAIRRLRQSCRVIRRRSAGRAAGRLKHT
jgi:hypothetical protein